MPAIENLRGCVRNPEGRQLEFLKRSEAVGLPFVTVEVVMWRDPNTAEVLIGTEVQPRGGGQGVEMWASGKLQALGGGGG